MAKAATRDSRGMERLLAALDGPMRVAALAVVGPGHVEDAVQAARIKLWRRIDRCDLSRPSTVKAWLMRVAVRAMRDEGRKCRRHHREQNEIVVDPAAIDEQARVPRGTPVFTGLLALYVEDLKQYNDFAGSHARIGKQFGVRRGRMSVLFHRAVKEFVAGLPKHEADRLRRESGRSTVAELLAGCR